MNLKLRNGLFIILFIAITLITLQVNLSPVIGKEGQFFTAFQLYAPIAGAFLGIFGIFTVLGAQLLDFAILGKSFTLLNLLRVIPILFAVYFFSRKKNQFVTLTVPVLAILLFWLHPVGREAWPFALFWTIPLIAHFFPKNLLWKSFGATFSAHAVGSIIWLYTLPMSAGQWMALVPNVLIERTGFAIGIAGSYLAINALLERVTANWKVPILQVKRKTQKT